MGRTSNRKWANRVRRYLKETKVSKRLHWFGLFGGDRRFFAPLVKAGER